MGKISHFREIVWPLLEKEEIKEEKELTISEIEIGNSENLKFALDQTLKRYEAEDERRKNVEAKAALFIGTISIITTIVVGVTTLLIKETSINLLVLGLIILLFFLSTYMVRTVWFAIQTLERKNYFTLSPEDFFILDKALEKDYEKHLIITIVNKIKKNYRTINNKVDSMTMAQEYFKRAISIVVFYSFLLLIFVISKSDFGSLFKNFNFWKLKIDLNTLNFIFLYIISVLALILSIFSLSRKKKKK